MLGLLNNYPTRSGYLIAPVVVWVGASAEISPNQAELGAAIALNDIERRTPTAQRNPHVMVSCHPGSISMRRRRR